MSQHESKRLPTTSHYSHKTSTPEGKVNGVRWMFEGQNLEELNPATNPKQDMIFDYS